MKPSERHLEIAEDVLDGVFGEQQNYAGCLSVVATALAQVERDGMKRAAVIVQAVKARERYSEWPYATACQDAIDAILAEAEGAGT